MNQVRWTSNVTITIGTNGRGTGQLAGPPVGYTLTVTGGTVRSKGAGGPTMTIYSTVEADGLVIAALQVAAINNISGDGQTILYPGEFPLIVIEGGNRAGLVSVTLTGYLEMY